MKTRILTLLLSLLMLFSLLPVTVLAVEDFVASPEDAESLGFEFAAELPVIFPGAPCVTEIASGDCGAEGSNLTWVLTDDGTLTVKGTGAMADYKAGFPRPSWDTYKDQITALVVKPGVTSIGVYAFYNYTALQSVSLPAGLTELREAAFYGCSALTSFTAPASLTTVGPYAFYACTGLESVCLPVTGALSIASFAFQSCKALKEIAIPEGVTAINSYTFSNCDLLEHVTLPSTLKTIGQSAFNACKALRSVVIPAGVTSLGASAFNNCGSLTEINIPASVTTMGSSLFSGCSALKTIYFDGSEAQWKAIKTVPYLSGVTVCYPLPADETLFPDEAFRSFVLSHFDADRDGALSYAERYAVTAMDCSEAHIADLSGIECFPSLAVLACSGNALSTLDLTAAAALTKVTTGTQHISLTAAQREGQVGCTVDLKALFPDDLSRVTVTPASGVRYDPATGILTMTVPGAFSYTYDTGAVIGGSALLLPVCVSVDEVSLSVRVQADRGKTTKITLPVLRDGLYYGKAVKILGAEAFSLSSLENGRITVTARTMGSGTAAAFSVPVYWLTKPVYTLTVVLEPVFGSPVTVSGAAMSQIEYMYGNPVRYADTGLRAEADGRDVTAEIDAWSHTYFVTADGGDTWTEMKTVPAAVGQYKLVIQTADDVYSGAETLFFSIKPRPLTAEDVSFSIIPTQIADGRKKTPHPCVTLNGKPLREGTDFTYSYENNVKPGKATVTVSFKGNYSGEASMHFYIRESLPSHITGSIATVITKTVTATVGTIAGILRGLYGRR